MDAVRIDRGRGRDAVDAEVDRIQMLGGAVYIDTSTGDMFAVNNVSQNALDQSSNLWVLHLSSIPSNWKMVSLGNE